MLTILWWVLGSIGALFVLLFLWLGYRAFKFRRLQPVIFEYLALQDVEAALRYIKNTPGCSPQTPRVFSPCYLIAPGREEMPKCSA